MPVRIKTNRSAGQIVLSELEKRMRTIGEEVEVNARGVMRRQPMPSRPGHPPRIDTGVLVKSIMSETHRSQNSIETRVGTNIDYGLYLELGTEKMAPRPWLRPAFRTLRRQYRKG